MTGSSPAPPSSGSSAPGRIKHATLRSLLARISEAPETLHELLDDAPEALVAFRPDRRILHANRAAEVLFGHPPAGLEGQSTDVLVAPRMRQPDAPPMAPLPDVVQVDLPGAGRDGGEMAIEWAFGSTSTPRGIVFVMTVRDRAEAERALDALRTSEERFRLLVDGVQGYALFMLDPTGRVSSWNQGAERSKGWSAEEILGAPYDVFFTPEDRAAGVPRKLLDAAERAGHHEVVGWRVRKDGSRFLVNSTLTALRSPQGELRGYAKITRDLTERLAAEELARRVEHERAGRQAAEAAEQRARASEDRLRRLQQVTAALSEAATPLDVATVVLEQSLQALGASGSAIYTLSEDGLSLDLLAQRGHPAAPLDRFEHIPMSFEAPTTDAVRERRPAFYSSFEACAETYPHLRAAFASAGFEASAAIPLLVHGTALGTLGIRFSEVRDFDEADRSLLVTLSELGAQALDRARLFAAERRARAAAESASRAKDEFLAMLGHELRNPLAPIVTALSLMKLRQDATSQKERTVIERQITHLTRLVDDLLDVSRITRGKVALKRENLELGVIVGKAVEMSSPILEQRRHYLEVAVPADGLLVYADATRLSQVVSNLLINAAKYTPPGGHIAVVAQRRDDRITLVVRDDGQGIDPAILPHVFDLFAQERQGVDRSQGGLGLGLAIVKSMVTLHEGAVCAESAGRGKGSTFTVELPAASPSDSTPSLRAARVLPKARGAGRRVLIVDDNNDAAELLAESLRARGHVTMVAHDGPRALQLVDAFLPDVALLDIGLPVMDGYELARRLRTGLAGLRLIAVTGYGQESDRAKAYAAGFDAHMIKPVDPEALEAALG